MNIDQTRYVGMHKPIDMAQRIWFEDGVSVERRTVYFQGVHVGASVECHCSHMSERPNQTTSGKVTHLEEISLFVEPDIHRFGIVTYKIDIFDRGKVPYERD